HFAMSFLGRYRIPLWIMSLFALIILTQRTKLEFFRLAPLALVDNTFAYERIVFPAGNIAVTIALSLSFLAVGFILGLAREGALAESRARRMPPREKLLIGVICLATLPALAVHDDRVKRPPWDLPNATSFKKGGVTGKIWPAATPETPER